MRHMKWKVLYNKSPASKWESDEKRNKKATEKKRKEQIEEGLKEK